MGVRSRGDERLREARRELASQVEQQAKAKRAHEQSIAKLQQDLVRLQRDEMENARKAGFLEKELQDLYDSELPDARMRLQEKSAELRGVHRNLDKLGPAWVAERHQLLVELE